MHLPEGIHPCTYLREYIHSPTAVWVQALDGASVLVVVIRPTQVDLRTRGGVSMWPLRGCG